MYTIYTNASKNTPSYTLTRSFIHTTKSPPPRVSDTITYVTLNAIKWCTSSHDNGANPNSLQTLLQTWLAEKNLNPSDPRLVCVSMCLCVRKRITSEQWMTGSLMRKHTSCVYGFFQISTPCGLIWIINRALEM
jgi:hypothetical protein